MKAVQTLKHKTPGCRAQISTRLVMAYRRSVGPSEGAACRITLHRNSSKPYRIESLAALNVSLVIQYDPRCSLYRLERRDSDGDAQK